MAKYELTRKHFDIFVYGRNGVDYHQWDHDHIYRPEGYTLGNIPVLCTQEPDETTEHRTNRSIWLLGTLKLTKKWVAAGLPAATANPSPSSHRMTKNVMLVSGNRKQWPM